MGDETGNWCLIESDPGVFTELIREFGNLPSPKLIRRFLSIDDDSQKNISQVVIN